MGHVRDILKSKNASIISVTPDTIVFSALQLMVEKNVSALLVMDLNKLVGIFTERDYARKVILRGKASKKTAISEIMTPDPITVLPDSTIDECMQLMTNKFIRHLPVVEENRVLGIISIGDVVKFVINEQQYVIQNLEQYIAGS